MEIVNSESIANNTELDSTPRLYNLKGSKTDTLMLSLLTTFWNIKLSASVQILLPEKNPFISDREARLKHPGNLPV